MGRPQCCGCFRKHVAQATVLMDEAFNGYSVYRWLAMGHLAEAESEIRTLYPDYAKRVRAARLQIQDNTEFDPKKDPDLFKILFDLNTMINGIKSVQNDGITNTRAYQFWDDCESEVAISEKEMTGAETHHEAVVIPKKEPVVAS